MRKHTPTRRDNVIIQDNSGITVRASSDMNFGSLIVGSTTQTDTVTLDIPDRQVYCCGDVTIQGATDTEYTKVKPYLSTFHVWGDFQLCNEYVEGGGVYGHCVYWGNGAGGFYLWDPNHMASFVYHADSTVAYIRHVGGAALQNGPSGVMWFAKQTTIMPGVTVSVDCTNNAHAAAYDIYWALPGGGIVMGANSTITPANDLEGCHTASDDTSTWSFAAGTTWECAAYFGIHCPTADTTVEIDFSELAMEPKSVGGNIALGVHHLPITGYVPGDEGTLQLTGDWTITPQVDFNFYLRSANNSSNYGDTWGIIDLDGYTMTYGNYTYACDFKINNATALRTHQHGRIEFNEGTFKQIGTNSGDKETGTMQILNSAAVTTGGETDLVLDLGTAGILELEDSTLYSAYSNATTAVFSGSGTSRIVFAQNEADAAKDLELVEDPTHALPTVYFEQTGAVALAIKTDVYFSGDIRFNAPWAATYTADGKIWTVSDNKLIYGPATGKGPMRQVGAGQWQLQGENPAGSGYPACGRDMLALQGTNLEIDNCTYNKQAAGVNLDCTLGDASDAQNQNIDD